MLWRNACICFFTKKGFSGNGKKQFIGNKAKGRISKRVFQESKATNFRKTNIFYPLMYVSGGKKCSLSGKFGVLGFLETPISKIRPFALLPTSYNKQL